MIEITNNTVLIPKWMTWQRFGCKSEAYYNQYIKDKELEIVTHSEHLAMWGGNADEPHTLLTNVPERTFIWLKDATGDTWNVNELDLIADKKESERRCWPWLKDPIREKGYDAVAAEIEEMLRHKGEPKERLKTTLKALILKVENLNVLSSFNVKVWSNRVNHSTEPELEQAVKELQGMLGGER